MAAVEVGLEQACLLDFLSAMRLAPCLTTTRGTVGDTTTLVILAAAEGGATALDMEEVMLLSAVDDVNMRGTEGRGTKKKEGENEVLLTVSLMEERYFCRILLTNSCRPMRPMFSFRI